MATIVASRVATLRRTHGFSQQALSAAAGITRQAVGAIESGRMQPSVGIALRLARALETTVEELFGPHSAAVPAPSRNAVATIAGRSVSHALDRDLLAIEPSGSATTVFVAGCDLSAGLLTRHAMARSRDVRVVWLTMTNRAALDALVKCEVHAAVIHGALLPEQARRANDFVRFEVATTEAGWVVARGNPLDLRQARDLVTKRARLVNRPAGAGARRLLDEQLRRAEIEPRRLAGYDRIVAGQLDAGRAIAQGFADVAVGMASAARAFDLDFLALRDECCALFVPRAALRTPQIRALLESVRSAPYRRDLEALGSYDTTRTGERLK